MAEPQLQRHSCAYEDVLYWVWKQQEPVAGITGKEPVTSFSWLL